MRDGFFEPMFTGYEIATRDVKVQKNNWIDGKYRILDPWAGLFGENYGGPALYIDASNPDCVVIPYQETGVRVSARGACYILSASSLYETAEEFLASEDAVANITLDENGKIEIKMVPTPLTDGSTIECSPIYTNWPDWSGNENGLYIVRGEDCFIQLPQFSGINKAIVDENAPVEYYNIMGQRIANPAAGQLVIKKQGTAVSKMIVR